MATESVQRLQGYAPDAFAVNLPASYGLVLAIQGGTLDVDGAWADVAATTVTLTDGATNYVERTLDGTVTANQTAFTVTKIPLCTAVTAGGRITAVTDKRPAYVGPIGHLEETILATAFTDGGAAVGTKTMTGSIPAGAILLGTKVLVNAGFAGDTSAALTIGDGSDVDRYNTSTIDIFTTAAAGVQSGVPSGNKLQTTAVQPVLTVTSDSDITPVIAGAGSITVSIFYLKTV